MNEVALNPYIFFKGDCREAMEFYKSVFGGDVNYTTYGDTPIPGMDANSEWIMHAELSGGEVKLFGSDTQNASPKAKKVSLALGGSNEAKLRKIFDDLSADGKIFQPLERAPWGDLFGSFTDKFGVEWMMNIAAKKS
ncbi:MAG TPA: VOC family protein [Candidatus Saccharimonadales bacterium]|nr:VOC family protein [Candidatus Saccharimonadales bacterium]